ncbi:Mitochondrial ribosomal protein L4 [Balamuthia mandrillaris]
MSEATAHHHVESSAVLPWPLHVLPYDACLHVFAYLNAEELLGARLVCSLWKSIADDGHVWKQQCAEPPSVMAKPPKRHLPRFFTNVLKTSHWKELYKELATISKDDASLDNFCPLLAEGLEASSTDHPTQSIAQTLDRRTQTFWSSKGSADMESSEFLVYRLLQPICIIRAIDIIVYRAGYQIGIPMYPPQSLQISVGFGPRPEDMHYRSPIFPVENTSEPQHFLLEPELVFGAYVRIDLYGRVQTQPDDDLFYTVLQEVKASGIPFGLLHEKQILCKSLIRFAIAQESFLSNLLHPPQPKTDFTKEAMEAEDYESEEEAEAEAEAEEEIEAEVEEEEEQDEELEDEMELPKNKVEARKEIPKDTLQQMLSKIAAAFMASNDVHSFSEQLSDVLQSQLTPLVGAAFQVKKRQHQFLSLLEQLQLNEAKLLYFCAKPNEPLRSTETLENLRKLGGIEWFTRFLFDLFRLSRYKLNRHESAALVEITTNKVDRREDAENLTRQLIYSQKLTCTEELGDFLVDRGFIGLAADVYVLAHVHDKILSSFVEVEEFETLLRYCSFRRDIDYAKLLKLVKEKCSIGKVLEFALLLLSRHLLPSDTVLEVLDIQLGEGEWNVVEKLTRLHQQHTNSSNNDDAADADDSSNTG